MKTIHLIVPLSYGEKIETAIQEAKFFLKNVGIQTTVSNEPCLGEWNLSLGKTQEAFSRGLWNIADDLYDDGFVIKTIEKIWYVVSSDETGVLFGLYEWLKETAKLEIYSAEQFEMEEFTFLDVNKKVNPSFAYRGRGWYPWNKYDVATKNRLRYNEPNWITFAHTMLSILPKSKYYKDHPEYYATPTPMQLCLTNEEMTKAFIKESLENYITPEKLRGRRTGIFFVGEEDNSLWCQCENCKKAYAKYGLTGVLQGFVKKVTKAVNEHVEKTMPDKIVKTVTFAYGANQFPVDENFKPLDESVIFEKNMGIMLTVSTTYENWKERIEKYIKACKALGGESYVWSYDSIFDDELLFWDTLETGKELNELLVEHNALMHYDQGHYNANISFDELSNYVRGKLMWDVTLDEKALTKDFIRAFYKEGAEAVQTYYDEYSALQKSWNFLVQMYLRYDSIMKTKESYPQDKLERWVGLLTDAIEKCADEQVKLRIARERLTPLYLLVELYGEDLDKNTLAEYIEIFAKDTLENNIAYFAEHGPEYFAKDMHAKVTQWRSLLL